MAKLPSPFKTKVEEAIESRMFKQSKREYLGISGIGSNCPRSIWYSFRWVKDVEIVARLDRLFSRGHKEEPIIIADLEAIGVHCHSDQLEVVAGNGYIKGHIDGLADGIPDAPKTTHLLEFKTHNEKSFADLKKKGMKDSKPAHYAQMICYMHLLELKRGLYVAVNKNTDERYYERIEANPSKAQELLNKGLDIVVAEYPPDRIGNNTWWECKFCDFYDICHFGVEPEKNCRTCHFFDLHDEGVCKCSWNNNMTLVKEQQEIGCDYHQWMDGLK